MKKTKTEKLITLAKKNKGITRVDILKLGFGEGYNRTLDDHFKVKGTKEVNGRIYTNYVAR